MVDTNTNPEITDLNCGDGAHVKRGTSTVAMLENEIGFDTDLNQDRFSAKSVEIISEEPEPTNEATKVLTEADFCTQNTTTAGKYNYCTALTNDSSSGEDGSDSDSEETMDESYDQITEEMVGKLNSFHHNIGTPSINKPVSMNNSQVPSNDDENNEGITSGHLEYSDSSDRNEKPQLLTTETEKYEKVELDAGCQQKPVKTRMEMDDMINSLKGSLVTLASEEGHNTDSDVPISTIVKVEFDSAEKSCPAFNIENELSELGIDTAKLNEGLPEWNAKVDHILGKLQNMKPLFLETDDENEQGDGNLDSFKNAKREVQGMRSEVENLTGQIQNLRGILEQEETLKLSSYDKLGKVMKEYDQFVQDVLLDQDGSDNNEEESEEFSIFAPKSTGVDYIPPEFVEGSGQKDNDDGNTVAQPQDSMAMSDEQIKSLTENLTQRVNLLKNLENAERDEIELLHRHKSVCQQLQSKFQNICQFEEDILKLDKNIEEFQEMLASETPEQFYECFDVSDEKNDDVVDHSVVIEEMPNSDEEECSSTMYTACSSIDIEDVSGE